MKNIIERWKDGPVGTASHESSEGIDGRELEDAVSAFVTNACSAEETLPFLQKHHDQIGDFCVEVRHAYNDADQTPLLLLSELIRCLVGKDYTGDTGTVIEKLTLNDIAQRFVESNVDIWSVAAYLHGHLDETADFCLRVGDGYGPKQSTTAALRLAELLSGLIQE